MSETDFPTVTLKLHMWKTLSI